MDLDSLKHSYGVALKMKEIGHKLNLSNEDINELFVLGYNHDIGYQFIEDSSIHDKVGGNVLKISNYKYWKEVYYHGDIDVDYESLYLDILNMADMQIDRYGNDVGYDKRLLDIESRCGSDSLVYKKCSALIQKLKNNCDL